MRILPAQFKELMCAFDLLIVSREIVYNAMLRSAFAAYERSLHARPLTTKVPPPPPVRIHFVRLLHGRRICKFASQAVTSGCISGIGDFACQVNELLFPLLAEQLRQQGGRRPWHSS